jgi:hypothetical protein
MLPLLLRLPLLLLPLIAVASLQMPSATLALLLLLPLPLLCLIPWRAPPCVCRGRRITTVVVVVGMAFWHMHNSKAPPNFVPKTW